MLILSVVIAETSDVSYKTTIAQFAAMTPLSQVAVIWGTELPKIADVGLCDPCVESLNLFVSWFFVVFSILKTNFSWEFAVG